MGNIEEVLSWSNVTEQAAELGIGGDDNFFKVEDGENIIRVLTEPVHYGVYFQGKGIQPVFAENASEDVIEIAKGKLSHRFACYVYNNATKKVQLAEFGWSIVKAIGELATSSQYKYEGMPPFDIIITKKGSGMETKYTVNPGRNEDKMTDEVMEELKDQKDIKEYLDEKIARQAGEDANPNSTPEEKAEEAAKVGEEVLGDGEKKSEEPEAETTTPAAE